MEFRSDIAPDTLPVELDPAGVGVEYTDGRSVFYHGVPERAEGSVLTPPGKDVHVLVTDPTGTQGVLVYVNDRSTADEILEDTGVGRVLLDRDEESSIFPGVTVRQGSYRIEVEADLEQAGGRVFVFAEDETGEFAWELVAPDEEDRPYEETVDG
ncbi:DUF5796 family protein [Halomarina ordinaria]|uniref:DUF5796 family protein n=1 Tax=Halomarina ordinaria TaxID=3033939 RepID=A0ABD5U826_9EURY|nr:DUF5796 family protein [Halomarina sp. PSRA2]